MLMNNTNKRLLTLMKHHSDSQQTVDNELTRRLRKCHQASRGRYAAETTNV